MKKPGKARLLIRCRQLTVVSCIPKVARAGSSNQAAATVFWHSPVGQAKTGFMVSVIWELSSNKNYEVGFIDMFLVAGKLDKERRKEAETGLSITVSVRALR